MLFGRRTKPAGQAESRANSTGAIEVPAGLSVAAAYSWRLLVVLGLIAVLIFLIITLKYIVIPFLVAILIGALLVPVVNFLVSKKWPRGLAVTMTLIGFLAAVSGLVVVVVTQVRLGLPALQIQSAEAYDGFREFLRSSALQLTDEDLDGYLTQIFDTVRRDSEALVSGILSVGSTAGHVLAGAVLSIFAAIFVLIDGKRIWAWTVRLFPRSSRNAVDGAGISGWLTLTTFVKVQIFVAAVDATGIGLGAFILGLFYGGFPLVIPIAVAVFLGSFIPVVGALVTGGLAIFIALVFLGPIPAVIMLGIVLLVQQLEGHILQPLVMGTAVKVHPLAVVFAVAAGSFVAGIPGALFAVPLIAVVNVMTNYIASGDWRVKGPPTISDVLSHGN
ncbi:putative PurR-regulated permease PerM [Rhodoglobus vestalii]|uniref:Putative PurR-regulated permease PerM n=1 Tax=Rhodoglobus vestalii TaxID=193384 RepID=A0A8H2PXF5_9MICO|nr:AI-2E family transporter [Rhodoglobus vestalii]TQO19269.1 putative PurR-regulated permease PerM [Rhodoglobus vestalii]